MKVLVVSPTFGAFGGIESVVLNFVRELQRNEIDARLCFKRVRNFSLQKSLSDSVRESGVEAIFVDRASPLLFRLIQDADIIHCQNPVIDAALFSKFLLKKLIVSVYNRNLGGFNLHNMLWRLVLKLSDRILYLSDFVWQSWEPGRKGRGSMKLPIIYGLSKDIVPVEDRKGFIFIGRFIANKGLEILLEAYLNADIDKDAWPLTLIGEGPLLPKIEEFIKGHAMKGVTIRGFVDEREKLEAIRHARWMVTPPHTNEDLGLAPIEARRTGVPCIITRDGGLPEAAGRYALSCAPGNIEELRKLLEKAAGMNDPDYRNLSKATYEELAGYLKAPSAYAEVYSEVMEGRIKGED